MKLKIPAKPHLQSDYTAYWENFLTDEEINTLLASPEWLNLDDAKVEYSLLNKEARTAKIAWARPCEKTQFIWDKIVHVIADVNRRYFHYDLTEFSDPPQLGLYSGESNRSDFYEWHIDAQGNTNIHTLPRKLSVSILLDDPAEFDGGNLQVKVVNDDVVNLEQKKGRAWFFSSHTLHRVSPVTKGVRRSIVIWCAGPPFK